MNFFQSLKTKIKDRIYAAAGELAWHMGCVIADAFEARGEQITLLEMERQDAEETAEIGVELTFPVRDSKDKGKAN